LTWRSHAFPKIVAVFMPLSMMAFRLRSFSLFMPHRLVLPKAAITELFSAISLTLRKYSSSFGFEPGHPPSMYVIPKSSSFEVILSLSWREKLTSTDCAPSRRVVS